jgi:hypothetical protein
MSEKSRAARLAVLRDRQARGAALPSDGAEALDLAEELQAELENMGGWKKMTSAVARELELSRAQRLKADPYLARLTVAEEKWAKFATTFTQPRLVFVTVVLILLMIGAKLGVFTVRPIEVDVPGLFKSEDATHLPPETAGVP